MIKIFHQIVASMILIGAQPATAQDTWMLEGLDMPESVLVDSKRAQLLVSNIVGHPGDTDANGYLSRVSLDGTLIERECVTGLDAPKGMALIGGELLVADLGRLHIIDVETGLIMDSLAPDGALFLNDVTSDALADISADSGTLYLPLMLDGQVKKQLITVGMVK